MNKLIAGYFLFIIFVSALLNSCSQNNVYRSDLYPLQTLIPIPKPTVLDLSEFNSEIKSEFVTIEKELGNKFSGYRTKNKEFLEKIISPLLTPYIEQLSKMSKVDVINVLTLFGYEIYQTYIGSSFYRWGGDILDLDDPQESSIRYKYAYGLDCSGFTALPYELAVYFDLLKPEEALFSSKGFESYCKANNRKDIGGREGTSNNFRLDTPELAELGTEVFRLEKGQAPTPEQIKLLKAGDIVGRNGHFGIIAFIKGDPFYLESGGWVVPKNNGIPVEAPLALKIFASIGTISIRRCLN